MAVPTTRAEFKEHCLRRLGKPILKINVADDQIDDRIDEALKYYYDYHFSGTEKVYFKHQITSDDITNQYITLPENIIGAIRIFDINSAVSSSAGMFSYQYQFVLNDLYTTMGQSSILPYYTMKQKYEEISAMFTGRQRIRYNRHLDKFYIDTNWDRFNVGDYLVIEAYSVVDPDTYTDAWGDRWLQRYATALIKRQWGIVLSRYEGMQLPGAIAFSGAKMIDDAVAEIAELEQDMISSYSIPPEDMIG